jgi:hypothetical protein
MQASVGDSSMRTGARLPGEWTFGETIAEITMALIESAEEID